MLSRALPSQLFWWKISCSLFLLDYSINLLSTFTTFFLCKWFGLELPLQLSLFALVGLSTPWLTKLHSSNLKETNMEVSSLPSTSWEAKEVNGEVKVILSLLSSLSQVYYGSSLAELNLLNNSKTRINSLKDASSTESWWTYILLNKCLWPLTKRNHLGTIQHSCLQVTTTLEA